MVLFGEFNTALRKTKALDTAKNKTTSSTSDVTVRDTSSHADDAEISNSTTKELAWSQRAIGKNLESCEVQFVISTFIYFDLFASIIIFLIDSKYTATYGKIDETVYPVESIFARLLSSFQSFTLFCFVLEIGALFYAFRLLVLSHFGYCLDIIIISFIIYDDIYDIPIFPSRLLGLLRIWRVARLVTTLLDQAQASHDATKSDLQNVEEKIKKLQVESKQLKESNRVEIDFRKQVEKMLQGFKDEVDTLKEALQIAALDVAGAAEEEFDARKEGREIKYVDDLGDQYYDGNDEETHLGRKVIVHEDGTFELY